MNKTCKGSQLIVKHTDLIFCDFPKVYGENAKLLDRGNPCAANFRVVLQSDVITSALFSNFELNMFGFERSSTTQTFIQIRHLYINSIQNTVALAEVRHVTQLIDRSCDATDVILNESDHPHLKDLSSGEVSGRRAGVRMMMMCGVGFMWAGGRISFVLFFIWLTALYLQCASKGARAFIHFNSCVCVCVCVSACLHRDGNRAPVSTKNVYDMSHQFYVNISYRMITRFIDTFSIETGLQK